jgi:RNA polymerase sigma-70 factor (ECF subfamily)
MDANDWQTRQFEQNREHLRAVARRMLGSAAEADDAVQEAWLRLHRADTSGVENVRGWLTTVVGRICLDILRARQARREEFFERWPAEPVVTQFDPEDDPEQAALLADSVGVALMVVLDTLSPAERLAFVLHDMFGVPFDEIAPIVERSVPATRQLASRARRRVRGAPEPREPSLARQREVVEAFLRASRNGDFAGLLAMLDPEVVFRGDSGAGGPRVPVEVRGADNVARLVLARGTPMAPLGRPAVIDGRPGAVVVVDGRALAVVAFTIDGDHVTEMDLLVDPDRLRHVRV